MSTTLNQEEVNRFADLASKWWDPKGPMKPLHEINPLRMRFINDEAMRVFATRMQSGIAPFKGLTCLDIGCGAGILAETLARRGFAVTGIDATDKMINIAKEHAVQSGLSIDYRIQLVEELVREGKQYDLVCASEVIEHVENPAFFMEETLKLVAPNGLFFGSTINRTLKSFALSIVGAEYVLRWLPRGTHDHKKFIRPNEFEGFFTDNGFHKTALKGYVFNPLFREWSLSDDTDVNYLIAAERG